MDDSERQRQRSSRRAFIRSHHPDFGGDPDLFAAALADFDRLAADAAAEAAPRVTGLPRRAWPTRLARALRRRRGRSRRSPRRVR